MKTIIFTFFLILNAIPLFSQKETITSFQLSHFVEGERLWEMQAEKAEINKITNEIFLKNFLVKFYKNNKPVSSLRANTGKVDGKKKQMEGKDNVQIESLREKTKINTNEVNYLSQEKKIFSSSFVEVKRNETLIKGEGLETTPDLIHISIKQNASSFNPIRKFTIVSEKMDIFQEKGVVEFKNKVKFNKEKFILLTDYLCYDEKEQIAEAKSNAALFLGDVQEGKVKVTAEKIIFYEKEGKVEAKGKVKIEQDKNYAFSEEAYYYAQEEKLILTSGPPVVYQSEDKRKGEYRAEKVIFYLAEKRISFEGNMQGIITYPE